MFYRLVLISNKKTTNKQKPKPTNKQKAHQKTKANKQKKARNPPVWTRDKRNIAEKVILTYSLSAGLITYVKKLLINLSQTEGFVFFPYLLSNPSLLHIKIHMHTDQFINHRMYLSLSSPCKLHLYKPKKPRIRISLSDFLLNLCKCNNKCKCHQMFNFGTGITFLLHVIPLVCL